MRYGKAGRWWRFVDKSHWPQDEQTLQAIMKHWQTETGDCRQELVFIGQGMDMALLNANLDACLLTEEELQRDPQSWRFGEDPFGSWVAE